MNQYLNNGWHADMARMLTTQGRLFAHNDNTRFFVYDGKAYSIRNDTVVEHGDYFTFIAYMKERRPATFVFEDVTDPPPDTNYLVLIETTYEIVKKEEYKSAEGAHHSWYYWANLTDSEGHPKYKVRCFQEVNPENLSAQETR